MEEKTTNRKKIDINQVCNELKFNQNTRSYVELKYKGSEFTLRQWKEKFKKDKLSY